MLALAFLYGAGTMWFGCMSAIGLGMGMSLPNALCLTFLWPVVVPLGIVKDWLKWVTGD